MQVSYKIHSYEGSLLIPNNNNSHNTMFDTVIVYITSINCIGTLPYINMHWYSEK